MLILSLKKSLERYPQLAIKLPLAQALNKKQGSSLELANGVAPYRPLAHSHSCRSAMRFIASSYCFYFISQNTLLKDLLFKVSNGIEPMSPRHKLEGITCWPVLPVGLRRE